EDRHALTPQRLAVGRKYECRPTPRSPRWASRPARYSSRPSTSSESQSISNSWHSPSGRASRNDSGDNVPPRSSTQRRRGASQLLDKEISQRDHHRPQFGRWQLNKPKTLTGLNQQVCGWAQRLPPSAAVVHTATGEQAEPTSSVGISVERGKPVAFPEF